MFGNSKIGNFEVDEEKQILISAPQPDFNTAISRYVDEAKAAIEAYNNRPYSLWEIFDATRAFLTRTLLRPFKRFAKYRDSRRKIEDAFIQDQAIPEFNALRLSSSPESREKLAELLARSKNQFSTRLNSLLSNALSALPSYTNIFTNDGVRSVMSNIVSFLGRTDATASFSKVSKTAFAFMSHFSIRRQFEINDFFKYLANGDQPKVQSLLEKYTRQNPHFVKTLCTTKQTVFNAGRHFMDISALQLAIWNYDRNMFHMLIIHTDKEDVAKQLLEIEKGSCKYIKAHGRYYDYTNEINAALQKFEDAINSLRAGNGNYRFSDIFQTIKTNLYPAYANAPKQYWHEHNRGLGDNQSNQNGRFQDDNLQRKSRPLPIYQFQFRSLLNHMELESYCSNEFYPEDEWNNFLTPLNAGQAQALDNFSLSAAFGAHFNNFRLSRITFYLSLAGSKRLFEARKADVEALFKQYRPLIDQFREPETGAVDNQTQALKAGPRS